MIKTNTKNTFRTSFYVISLILNISAIIYPQQALTTDSLKTDTLEVHPQDVREDAGYVIQAFDGGLRIYGSVRLAGAYDLNGLTDANNFSTYDIPVGDEAISQPRFFMVPNQTRLGLEATKIRELGMIKLKIETDFLGENNAFRIRHAYVESGNFLVGQTWSSFTDVNSIPLTVDADGPNSSVRLRTVRIRYANHLFGKKIRYVVSLESPNPDINLPDSLSHRIPSQFIPDFAGLLRYNFNEGYVMLSSIIRGITVTDLTSSSDQLLGYGFLTAGTYELTSRDKFLFQAVYGRAITRFITALFGKGLDIVYNPNTQTFETTATSGVMLSYVHKWRVDAASTFTFGQVSVYNKDFEPPDAFNYSFYFSGNIFWNPLLGIRLGLELSYGRRENKDGESGVANRIGFVFYTDF